MKNGSVRQCERLLVEYETGGWNVRKLTFLLIFIAGFFQAGCFSDRYSSSNVGVGVASMSVGGLDLKDQLDVSILPSVVEEVYKEGLQAKLKGEELQRHVVRRLSERIREISTVDLNEDQVTDPILIVPEGDEEYMTYSVRVPNPEEVRALPSGNDASAWEDIAQNKSVELVALTAFPRTTGSSMDKVDIEAKPSSSFYTGSPSYHRSFTSDLLQYMIIRDLFFRPYWYGPGYYGWYGGYYRPYTVAHVSSTRTVTKYSSGTSSYNSMKTNSGKTPQRSASSLNASKKSFSVAKNTATKSSGGFGRSGTPSSSARSGGFGRSSSSSSGGFGRGSSSSSRYGGSGGFSSSSSSSGRGFFSSSSSGGGIRGGK